MVNPLSFKKAPMRASLGSEGFVLVLALVAFAAVLLPEPANALPVFAWGREPVRGVAQLRVPSTNPVGRDQLSLATLQ